MEAATDPSHEWKDGQARCIVGWIVVFHSLSEALAGTQAPERLHDTKERSWIKLRRGPIPSGSTYSPATGIESDGETLMVHSRNVFERHRPDNEK